VNGDKTVWMDARERRQDGLDGRHVNGDKLARMDAT